MTEPHDLRDLLELATDRVETPGLARGALATAGRRRRHRRAGLVAAAAAVVVVAGVAVAGSTGGGSSDEPMPAPSPPSRTAEPDLVTFDPQRVDDLPPAPAGVAPVLPEVLDVPTTSTPSLAEDPVATAVLTVARPDALKVLGSDGGWRHVPLPIDGGSVALSPDGTRLLVQTAAGVDVWDVTTGNVSSVPTPPEPGEEIGWIWRAAALVVYDPGRAWVVDPATGAVGRELDRDSLWDVGVDVGWSDADGSLTVTSGERRLLVRDDARATYANGGLSAEAVLDDGTVLLRVLVDPGPAASVRYVAWEPRSGQLWWVMHVPDLLPGWSLATGALG